MLHCRKYWIIFPDRSFFTVISHYAVNHNLKYKFRSRNSSFNSFYFCCMIFCHAPLWAKIGFLLPYSGRHYFMKPAKNKPREKKNTYRWEFFALNDCLNSPWIKHLGHYVVHVWHFLCWINFHNKHSG